MSKEKKISISALIPNFNHGHYIGIQLDSMINQTRPPDEIIIIDDASTDDSVEIIEGYIAKYEYIKLIKNDFNCGVESNINKLIDYSNGDFVFLSAADDKVESIFFEEVEKVARKFPDVGVISGLVRLIDSDGTNRGIRMMPIISDQPLYLDPVAVNESFKKFGRWIQISAMVLNRKYVLEEGGQDTEVGSFADNFLAMVIALKNGAYFIPKELGCWRKMDTGYGHIFASEVSNLIKIGNLVSDRMNNKYRCFFDKLFIERFLSHWIYMVLQNLGDISVKKKFSILKSSNFRDLCYSANISRTKFLFAALNFFLPKNKLLYIVLFYPKSWLFRSRISVFKYTSKFRLSEYQ